MSELLNYRTLFVVSGIVAGMLLILHVMQTRKPYPGFLRMTVGMETLAAVTLIAGLRGYVPYALLLVQIAALFAFALIGSGIKVFYGAQGRDRWLYFYIPAGIAALTFFFFTRPLPPRMILTSLLLVPLFVYAALPLLKTPPKGRAFGQRFTAMVLLLWCVAAFIRIAAVVRIPAGDSPYFAHGVANTAYFLLILFLFLGLAFGFIVLAHERLVAELRAAHERCLAESTERARLEQQLAEANKLAAMGRIAGGVAHFFNNEMFAVQLASGMFRQSLGSSGTASAIDLLTAIETVDKACRRSSEITARLLQYAQTPSLQVSQFTPHELMDRLVPVMRKIAGKKIEITLSCSSSLPELKMDANLLEDSMLILVRNAREAMPAGGKLMFSFRSLELDFDGAIQLDVATGNYVVLSVSDTGSGMDDETLQHIFEPFYTTRGLANADGLGLASAFGFIRQSGGTITVHSAPQAGSTFELYLPAVQVEAAEGRPATSEPSATYRH